MIDDTATLELVDADLAQLEPGTGAAKFTEDQARQWLAIYVNPHRQLVIRAYGGYDDDTCIVISPEYVPRVIAKMRAVLAEIECDG